MATINVSGALKKTADLTPFSVDPPWNARPTSSRTRPRPSRTADDIIFGGLGSDCLHGGSGDDAISGAEALVESYVPVYDAAGASAPATGSPRSTSGTRSTRATCWPSTRIDLDGRHRSNRPDRRVRRCTTSTTRCGRSGSPRPAAGQDAGRDGEQFLLNFNGRRRHARRDAPGDRTRAYRTRPSTTTATTPSSATWATTGWSAGPAGTTCTAGGATTCSTPTTT